jgi:DNA oxidative demethylase
MDLFASVSDVRPSQEVMAEGAVLLRGFARAHEAELVAVLRDVIAEAPFRHMVTPGGFRMSVAMTNAERPAGSAI